MIISDSLDNPFNQQLLKKLCCPVCLSNLFLSGLEEENLHYLTCKDCCSKFAVYDRIPILLVGDENWNKKKDEIDGEVDYNKKFIPPEVHIERNTFVNNNTEKFLNDADIDLTNDDALIVGSSFEELKYFAKKCRNIISLDIVPSLVKDCRKATDEQNISAEWICGDGECLPFEDESFDSIIIRQSLHHMLKYYSAISEFFRVCKKGGNVLIIDEPFSPLNTDDLSRLPYSGNVKIYEEIEYRHFLEKFRRPANILPKQVGNRNPLKLFWAWARSLKGHGKRDISSADSTDETEFVKLSMLEKSGSYIQPDENDPESFLADKYHSFSLLNCIYAIRLHTDIYRLIWPEETAWSDESGEVVRFCHGLNPNYNKPLIDKLVSPGNVSIAAKKLNRTTVLRDRKSLKAIPTDLVLESLM
jgi:SAM-dependent methyltransferase